MKIARIISLICLIIVLFVFVDLGLNYLYCLIPNTEGITVNCVLHGLFGIFGDTLWSRERFFEAFQCAAWQLFFVAFINIDLAILSIKYQK